MYICTYLSAAVDKQMHESVLLLVWSCSRGVGRYRGRYRAPRCKRLDMVVAATLLCTVYPRDGDKESRSVTRAADGKPGWLGLLSDKDRLGLWAEPARALPGNSWRVDPEPRVCLGTF